MATNYARDYTFKDEELTVLCNLTSSSLSRDQADFASYSPKFTQEYVTSFESAIATANNVIEPQSEILEQKKITAKMFDTLNGLIDPINRLAGYIRLANGELKLTSAEFGLDQIRKSISAKDVEGVLNTIHVILANVEKYKEQLIGQGLTEELISKFSNASATLSADKKKQYELIIHRKSVVQDNRALFNNLYASLSEILAVGKILYKATDPAKRQEYTLSDLKKRVRRISKPAPAVTPANSAH